MSPLPPRPRRRVRILAWILLAGVLAADALVFTPVSLGVLYFLPLALIATQGVAGEALAMAFICWMGRMLFGPGSDPLGLEHVTLHLAPQVATATNATVALVGFLATAWALVTLEKQKQQLAVLDTVAGSDPLTGLANRRRLNEFLSRQDGSGPISVIAADIDHFKRINDRLGHGAGDEVLRQVALRLSGAVRTGELVARTGGEEFLLVLPGADEAAARRIAERVHMAVGTEPVPLPGESLPVTVSVGVATVHGRPDDALLGRADQALYAAKQNGRNRIEVAKAA